MYSDSQESHGLLTLHYGKHHATIVEEIKTCFDSESYADMTFICDDKTSLNAHRLIMASASPLVRRILVDAAHANGPVIIHIPGVKSVHMRHLLDFLYHGQACIKVSISRVSFSARRIDNGPSTHKQLSHQQKIGRLSRFRNRQRPLAI